MQAGIGPLLAALAARCKALHDVTEPLAPRAVGFCASWRRLRCKCMPPKRSLPAVCSPCKGLRDVVVGLLQVNGGAGGAPEPPAGESRSPCPSAKPALLLLKRGFGLRPPWTGRLYEKIVERLTWIQLRREVQIYDLIGPTYDE